MAKVVEGILNCQGMKAALVASRYNDFIVSRLLDGAIDVLVRHGAREEDITIIRVPGAFEIPQATSLAAKAGKYDMVIAVGAVIRGSTPHFDYIASETAKGVAQVALDVTIPVTFGVLTTDTLEQAIERAGSKAGNKGAEAAMSAIEMANLLRQL
ncbi:MAG: 6,7-dimethyl-8-ribityllumazine synthase [Thermodesulfobacteriota bacterium]|nr:6,7-dimethyl-8-ribityllumazine synthase [Thermodesulfobacteriota bacterium]